MATNGERKKRVVKCPHCSTVLVEGDDLCCQALKDELNQLASDKGSTIEGLTLAFNQWFEKHKVEGQ